MSRHQLDRECGVRADNFHYLVSLIDRHGLEFLNKSYSYYSLEFKEAAIKRVLINHESASRVSLVLTLSSSCMSFNWFRKYKEDGYKVINFKKVRQSHEKQKK